MPFSTLFLSGATVGMTTLAAFAISTPASAQEIYPHKHYTSARPLSPLRPPCRGSSDHRSSASNGASAEPGYAWGPVAAVGAVVVGTGQAVQGVFTGAGAVVGGVLGGVFGGTAALFGYPYNHPLPYGAPSYAYGAPFAAPFNAAGAVAASPFQAVGGAFGAAPAASPGY